MSVKHAAKPGPISKVPGESVIPQNVREVPATWPAPGLKHIRLFTICLIALVILLFADARPAAARERLPGEPCQIKSPRDPETKKFLWSKPERWVWKQVCEGEIADFNAQYGVWLDPKSADGWKEDRELSGTFLEAILLHEPFRSALTRKGVRIVGAWFPNPVDLGHGRLSRQLWLDRSRFESHVSLVSLRSLDRISVDGSEFTHELNMDSMEVGGDLFMGDDADFADVILRGAKIGGQLSMIGSKFTGELDMDSMEVSGNLFIRGGAEFGDVRLVGAKIGGQLSLIGSKFTGKLNMDKLQVGSSLFMLGGAEFGDVILRGAKIGGQLSMTGSNFTGKLDMDSMEVGGNLFMRGKAEFGEVRLRAAKIGGQLDMAGSKFTGNLDMDSTTVGSHLFMRGRAEFKGGVNLRSMKIGGALQFAESTFLGSQVDLTELEVHEEILFEDKKWGRPTWGEKTRLILRNARAGAIQDTDKDGVWPNRLELEGFQYDRLGGVRTVAQSAASRRPATWYVDWLKRDVAYSPQPYEQLAKVLRDMGLVDKANTVLFAKRERERRIAWCAEKPVDPCEKKLGAALMLESLKWTIGYGFRYHYALVWVIGLVLLGGVVWQEAREPAERRMPYGLMYSLDRLLPVIQLRRLHYEEIDLVTWARYYFYVHQIMGYVLVFFLIAGLSGLTK